MYAPTYAFAQGPSNAQQQAAFNQTAPPAAQPIPVPHYFPAQAHGQQPPPPPQQQQHQHQQQQQQQQMMYNSQQYAMGGAGAGPGPGSGAGGSQQQNPYAGMGVNPAMMQGNGGMTHMAVNNGVVQGYQTPYSSSPYNTGMPNSTGAMPMQQQFMMPTSNNAHFTMNNANLTPQQQQQQQQQQRMQHPQVSTPNPNSQRVSPYGGAVHNTPPQAQTQSQFMTPQSATSNHSHQAQMPLQIQNTNPSQPQQPQGQNTPQTPSFPPNSGGVTGPASNLQTPLSPASENREKERVSLLLDINRELLKEVIRLQALQAEAKKESTPNTAPTTDTKGGESKPPDKPNVATTGKDFVECMRRLQYNLGYLAAIADRSHKPSSQIPPHPAIISAPLLSPLPPKLQTKQSPRASPNQNPNVKTESTPSSETANGATNAPPLEFDASGSEETEDRSDTIKALYARLQSLFPGVDPKKEPPIQAMNRNTQQKGQAQRQNTNPGQNQMLGQGQGGAMPQQQAQALMMTGNMVPQGP